MDVLKIASKMGDLEEYYGRADNRNTKEQTKLTKTLIDIFENGTETFFEDKNYLPFYSLYLEKFSGIEKFEESIGQAYNDIQKDYEVADINILPVLEKMREEGKEIAQLTVEYKKANFMEFYQQGQQILMTATNREWLRVTYGDYTIKKNVGIPLKKTVVVDANVLESRIDELFEDIKQQNNLENISLNR